MVFKDKKIKEMSEEEFKKYNRDRARELRKRKYPTKRTQEICVVCGKEYSHNHKIKKVLIVCAKCHSKIHREVD